MVKISLISTIDISPLYGNDLEKKLKVAEQIKEACHKTGFFAISNHTIDCFDELTSQTHAFFKNLSAEQKLQLAAHKWNKNNKNTYRGFFPSATNGKEGLVNLFLS
jgi:isopenicillin-N synthase